MTAGSFVFAWWQADHWLKARDRRDQRDRSDAISGTLRAFTGIGDKRDRQAWREALTLPVPFVSGANLTRSPFKLRRFCLFGPLCPLFVAIGFFGFFVRLTAPDPCQTTLCPLAGYTVLSSRFHCGGLLRCLGAIGFLFAYEGLTPIVCALATAPRLRVIQRLKTLLLRKNGKTPLFRSKMVYLTLSKML